MITVQAISDRTFVNGRIDVDGETYVRCVFDHCGIVYSALQPVRFIECRFISCEWIFSESADLTLAYLSALYRGLGAQGAQLVESIFQRIREGSVSPTKSSQWPRSDERSR